MKNIFVFLGAPGCGKGTQSTMLAEACGLIHLSTGDILRNIMKENTDFGEKICKIMCSGDLVPDDIMIEILEKTVSKFPEAKGFIFDGFPRTLVQAEMFDRFLYKNFPASSPLFIELQVEETKLMERLAHRAIVEGRYDDAKPETIENRMKVFKDQTLPAIEQYRGYPSYCLFNVTGKKASEVYEEVEKLIIKCSL